jgi:hypothetical protein
MEMGYFSRYFFFPATTHWNGYTQVWPLKNLWRNNAMSVIDIVVCIHKNVHKYKIFLVANDRLLFQYFFILL